MPTPWLKVLLEGEREDLEQIQKLILERWSAFYECIFSSVNLLELTGKNVHKGAGVLEAAKYLGVAPEHIYCVGDNDNDLPMLRIAAAGFVPEGSVAAGRDLGFTLVRDADHGLSLIHISAPKRKREKHLRRVGTSAHPAIVRLQRGESVSDRALRRSLAAFRDSEQTKMEGNSFV